MLVIMHMLVQLKTNAPRNSQVRASEGQQRNADMEDDDRSSVLLDCALQLLLPGKRGLRAETAPARCCYHKPLVSRAVSLRHAKLSE